MSYNSVNIKGLRKLSFFFLLFLKIIVRLFSQNLTDSLSQSYHNVDKLFTSSYRSRSIFSTTLSTWSEYIFHFLLTLYFTSGLLKCYILLNFYPETVNENIFLDQLNRYSLIMANEARICQRYRRYPKRTSQAPRSSIFLFDDGGVPRCTVSGDDFDFV